MIGSAVVFLGGSREIASAAEADLRARYAEPHRRYHGMAHVEAVLRDSAWLAQELSLPPNEHHLLTLAAAAHDVIYDAQPGEDERRSAAWARDWLLRSGLEEFHVSRVESLILATLTHTAPDGDRTAHALLDADLAILGSTPPTYDQYAIAVRREYAAIDDPTWRTGRAAVLSRLLARQPLYYTAPAQARWEQPARANLARELELFGG